jgi:hypothetical protein
VSELVERLQLAQNTVTELVQRAEGPGSSRVSSLRATHASPLYA